MINIKEKINQIFEDKLFLVVLMLGLLTTVAAAGVITVQRGKGNETNPYPEMPQPEMIAQEIASEMSQMTGASDTAKEAQESEPTPIKAAVTQNANQGNDLAVEVGAGRDTTDVSVLSFTDTSEMEWPVKGNVLLDYNMDQTIYFPTLDQYKRNPGLVIQPDASTPVGTPANAGILEVGSNEEIGNYVVTDSGNEYTATCGQLKEVCAAESECLKKGQALGYVSESTKHYSMEGVNIFFELRHQGKTVDLSDYMEWGPENYR